MARETTRSFRKDLNPDLSGLNFCSNLLSAKLRCNFLFQKKLMRKSTTSSRIAER
jgi:hypothetical protein